MKTGKISDYCEVLNGFAFKSSDYSESGYRVIRITNVQKGIILDNYPKFISNEIADNLERFKLKAGDILVSLTGNVGRVGKVEEGLLPAVLNQRVGLIRPKTNEIYESYIFQYLNSNQFEEQAVKNAIGVAQLNLSSKWIENHLIPIPNTVDQKRIASLLEKVEGLINERKQNLEQLDELLKSVFLDMFDPQAKGYDDWPLVEIKDLAEQRKGAMRTGPFGSNLLHSEFVEEGPVAVLGIDNAVKNTFEWDERRYITEEKYQELQNYRIYPGDVIVTIMGTVGRSAVIPDDIPLAVNTKHLAAITLDKTLANPIFISYSIHSSPYILNQFKSKTRGAIMSGLNLGIIKETKLKRPPIELQNRFSNIYRKVDSIKKQYKSTLSYLQTLYSALSQKAFSGELDLSGIKLRDEEVELSSFDKLQQSIDTIDRLIPEPIRRMNRIMDNMIPPSIQRLQQPFKALNPLSENLQKALQFNEQFSQKSLGPFSYLELSDFKDPTSRPKILEHWFNEWLEDSQADELKLYLFWARAQRSLVDYLYEEDLEEYQFTVEDYDAVKTLVFQAIDNGLIKQTVNKVELNDKIEDGNRVVLVKG